jgi:hypothetical protein
MSHYFGKTAVNRQGNLGESITINVSGERRRKHPGVTDDD